MRPMQLAKLPLDPVMRERVQLSVGAVRAKNTKNIMLVILLDASLAMVMFYFTGWAFAYGGSYGHDDLANKFIGYGGFALNNLPRADWYMFFFQYTVRPPDPCICTHPRCIECGILFLAAHASKSSRS